MHEPSKKTTSYRASTNYIKLDITLKVFGELL